MALLSKLRPHRAHNYYRALVGLQLFLSLFTFFSQKCQISRENIAAFEDSIISNIGTNLLDLLAFGFCFLNYFGDLGCQKVGQSRTYLGNDGIFECGNVFPRKFDIFVKKIKEPVKKL